MLENVGRIIDTNIQAYKFEKNMYRIFFPTTIMQLVRDVEVKPTPKLYIIVSTSMIKKIFGNKFENDGPKR